MILYTYHQVAKFGACLSACSTSTSASQPNLWANVRFFGSRCPPTTWSRSCLFSDPQWFWLFLSFLHHLVACMKRAAFPQSPPTSLDATLVSHYLSCGCSSVDCILGWPWQNSAPRPSFAYNLGSRIDHRPECRGDPFRSSMESVLPFTDDVLDDTNGRLPDRCSSSITGQ